MAKRRLNNPALFVCDIQEKFRPAIYEYSKVIATTQKLIRACQILNIPIHATTQQSAKLGPLCAELGLPDSVPVIDKSAFGMIVPDLVANLPPAPPAAPPIEAIIVGIETHICVTQTTLDLLAMGHKVYVVVDGVSSCNEGERGVAIRRLQAEGAKVVTSEGVIYEVMGDAGIEEFRKIAGLVKETKEETKESVKALCKI